MRLFKTLLLSLLFCFSIASGQNRAPSLWFNYNDKVEGDIIMIDVKIPNASEDKAISYYSTLNFNSGAEGGGYAGIQHHDGQGHIFIFSIWDPVSSNDPISAEYAATGVEVANFGGEGTGLRTKNLTYGWKPGYWYTQTLRAWDYNGHTYFGFWIYDGEKQVWEHFVTMDFPVQGVRFNSGGTGSFLENWYGQLANYDGKYVRTMELKNGFKRNSAGQWIDFDQAYFSRVSPDAGANNYINNYDGGTTTDGYFMRHGGTTSPVTTTSGNYVNKSFGSNPNTTTGTVTLFNQSFSQSTFDLDMDWTISKSTSPQYSYHLEVATDAGFSNKVYTNSDIKPHLRAWKVGLSSLNDGAYYVRFWITDIFDNVSSYETFQINKGNTDYDCNNDYLGTAYYDNCNVCVEGNTGKTACVQDCNNDWGGTAYYDDCNACVEGNTGNNACFSLDSGYYQIVSLASNKCTYVSDQFRQTTCDDSPEQIWKIVKQQDGYYRIQNYSTGNYLNVTGTGNGAQIESCCGWNGTDDQLFSMEDLGNGQVHIYPKGDATKTFDLSGSSSADDATIIVYAKHGGNNQKFMFTPKTIDCNGDIEGEAFIDSCGICAEGNTGETAVTNKNLCVITNTTDVGFGFEIIQANGTLQISSSKAVQISILNIEGRTIKHTVQNTSHSVSLKHLSSGVYFVKCSNGITQKLVVK